MRFKTNSQAYLALMREIAYSYDFSPSPRGHKTIEKLNVNVTIQKPTSEPVVTNDEKRNKVIANYTNKELDWYESGDVKVENVPAKFWETLADIEGNVVSNYGHLIKGDESEGNILECPKNELLQTTSRHWLRTPYNWAKKCLMEDVNTRQAIVRINKPKHLYHGSKDIPCTMYLNFLIRGDRLHLIVRMRSNDLTFGFPYDIVYFSKLLHDMANDLDIEPGPIHFSADSCHIYERDLIKIQKMLGDYNE